MSIQFKETIMHSLQSELDMPVLSTEVRALTDETETFVTEHVIKFLESASLSRDSFIEEMNN